MSDVVQKSVLPNGLPVLTERLPGTRTATVGLWIQSGSRDEPAALGGVSHFIEHLLFKGTEHRTALQIAQDADAVGAQINAFTDKEHTCYYVRTVSAHLRTVFDVLSDMVLRSTFERDALGRERGVILEEIAAYEDAPDELVQDLLIQTMWDGHPLGRPVIGTAETVAAMPREDIVAFHAERYRPTNALLVAAGDLEHAETAGLAQHHFGAWRGDAPVHETAPPLALPRIRTRAKEVEQVHLAIGTAGLPQAHEDRFALLVLDGIVGSGMSSRLFQEIRETRGLVYAISSYPLLYREGGLFVIYAGTSPSQAEEVTRLALAELRRAPDTIDEHELARAKESLKSGLLLSLEGTASRMFMRARWELYFGRQFALDEITGSIDAVDLPQVRRLAADLFEPSHLALAAVGPFDAVPGLADALASAMPDGAQVHRGAEANLRATATRRVRR